VCDRHKAACLYIAHLKKGKEENRLNRVAGSTAITSSVRAVYTVEKVSEYVCKIIPDKSNTLGHSPKTYRSILLHTDEGYEISITEDINQEDETTKAKAEKFLIGLFQGQSEFLATDIYRMAALEGISSDALKKVKKNLGIKTPQPKRVGAPWLWQCPLYNKNLALSWETPKSDEKKPNEINESAERDESAERELKKTKGSLVTSLMLTLT
jgi:hypothetical protein